MVATGGEGASGLGAAMLRHPLARFAGVAGFGWCLDALILLAAVRLAGLAPLQGNVISSLAAASVVYLIAHHRVHEGRAERAPLRVALYVAYTLALVLAVSLLIGPLARALQATPWLAGGRALLAAKALVTPPQFACNFLVSRFLATRVLARPRGLAEGAAP